MTFALELLERFLAYPQTYVGAESVSELLVAWVDPADRVWCVCPEELGRNLVVAQCGEAVGDTGERATEAAHVVGLAALTVPGAGAARR